MGTREVLVAQLLGENLRFNLDNLDGAQGVIEGLGQVDIESVAVTDVLLSTRCEFDVLAQETFT